MPRHTTSRATFVSQYITYSPRLSPTTSESDVSSLDEDARYLLSHLRVTNRSPPPSVHRFRRKESLFGRVRAEAMRVARRSSLGNEDKSEREGEQRQRTTELPNGGGEKRAKRGMCTTIKKVFDLGSCCRRCMKHGSKDVETTIEGGDERVGNTSDKPNMKKERNEGLEVLEWFWRVEANGH